MRVFSKTCRTCQYNQKQNIFKEHIFRKNYSGSSKSMEVQAILELTIQMWQEKNCCIGTIVSDDDTTMSLQLQHSYKEKVATGKMTNEQWPKTNNGNKKADNGRLPLHIPPPTFLADPNHRNKGVGKQLYAMANAARKISTIDKQLAMRLKDDWGLFIKQVQNLNIETDKEEILCRENAPVEHVFDNHCFCDPKWCYKIQAQKANKTCATTK